MINKNGGIDPKTKMDLEKAEKADLITLPQGVEGTNCFNCRFNKVIDSKNKIGFCLHPEVSQTVTSHMCCAKWDRKDVIRPWKKD